jgi:protein-disulfide isomerase
MIIGYIIGRFELTTVQVDNKTDNKTEKTQVEAQDKTENEPQEPAIVEVDTDDDPFLGNEDAPIVIIEFSDYQCPFCYKLYANILPSLKADFIDTGKVKYVFRDYPLNIHPSGYLAAEATECADDQGKFWEMHDHIFDNQSDWGSASDLNTTLVGYATELGLNTADFSECLTSEKYKDEVAGDKQDGVSYGVRSTPTMFINGEMIKGSPREYSQLKDYIESLLDS